MWIGNDLGMSVVQRGKAEKHRPVVLCENIVQIPLLPPLYFLSPATSGLSSSTHRVLRLVRLRIVLNPLNERAAHGVPGAEVLLHAVAEASLSRGSIAASWSSGNSAAYVLGAGERGPRFGHTLLEAVLVDHFDQSRRVRHVLLLLDRLHELLLARVLAIAATESEHARHFEGIRGVSGC